jgi:hypothetical protein
MTMDATRFQLILRSRRRRTARGAALLEAIIVSGMLMTLMAGGLFLHRLYVAQHQALEDARLVAWSRALQGCSSSGIDLHAVWNQAGAAAEPIDVESEVAPGFFGNVSHTTGSATHSAKAHARVGGGNFTLSASDSVACNEIAQSPRGDALDLLGYITASVVPSLF